MRAEVEYTCNPSLLKQMGGRGSRLERKQSLADPLLTGSGGKGDTGLSVHSDLGTVFDHSLPYQTLKMQEFI